MNMNSAAFAVIAAMAASTSIILGYAAGQFKAAGATGWGNELSLSLVMALVAGGLAYASLRLSRQSEAKPKAQDPRPRGHCRTDWRDDEKA